MSKRKWLYEKIEGLQGLYRSELQKEAMQQKDYELARADIFVTTTQQLADVQLKMLLALRNIEQELGYIRRHLEFLKSGTTVS